jgi:hypothetical protein
MGSNLAVPIMGNGGNLSDQVYVAIHYHLTLTSLQMQQKMSADEPKQPTNRPVLLDAIDITLRTIEGRARLYRNLVVAVSGVSMLSIIIAVLCRQWIPFAGLVLLVPLTGGFLFLDSRLVRRWRAGIIEMARMRSLDVATFLKTISGFRHIPPKTLKAMLSTIPASLEESRYETLRPEETVVDANFDALDRKNELKILCSTGLLTVALVCLSAGAFYGSLALLLSGGSLIIVLGVFGRR